MADTERLWCIVEIFTYLRMGGAPERMAVVPLAGARLDFSTFDAERAKCYSAEDKRKLLQAITLAFGSCEPFNLLVRTMLASRADDSAAVQASAAAAAAANGATADARAADVAEFAGPAHTLNAKKPGGFVHALNLPFAKRKPASTASSTRLFNPTATVAV